MKKNKTHWWIGITGGMGAGKSAVSRVFREAGYTVLSADEIAREVVTAGSDGLRAVVAVFGEGVVRSDGTLDRTAVRSMIADAPDLRLKLEAITHPLIQA